MALIQWWKRCLWSRVRRGRRSRNRGGRSIIRSAWRSLIVVKAIWWPRIRRGRLIRSLRWIIVARDGMIALRRIRGIIRLLLLVRLIWRRCSRWWVRSRCSGGWVRLHRLTEMGRWGVESYGRLRWCVWLRGWRRAETRRNSYWELRPRSSES